MAGKTEEGTAASGKPPRHLPGDGIRTSPATAFFRITNFELYAKPNKFVMTFGLASLSVALGLIGYMYFEKYQVEAEFGPVYKTITEEGGTEYRRKKSKWDI